MVFFALTGNLQHLYGVAGRSFPPFSHPAVLRGALLADPGFWCKFAGYEQERKGIGSDERGY